jgi:hypothetical protein
MSLPVLKAIRKLVNEGATVAGPKPTDDPSLADDQAEFTKIADELFGDGSGVHSVGKGKVYAGQGLGEAFKAMNVPPDFDYSKPGSDGDLEFLHRKLSDGDVYFVDNRSDKAQTVDATFRVSGRMPELWYAENGTVKPVAFKTGGGRTTLPLQLEPWGTVFAVFRRSTRETSHTLADRQESTLATVDGPWAVSFETDRGAPASITLDKLISWSDSSDSGVKYFSGVGTYTKTVQAPSAWFQPGSTLYLDLGEVKNLAEVTINGKNLGQVWHAPYRLEVTSALKPGANQIEIKVINSWVNRLIGDQQPDATKYTFADVHPYKANSPLLPSGLLGPVQFTRAGGK